ncbi:hypothetical protein ACFRH6_09300 [Streptomyces sp. NPDC056749]|uniref:hypothetical protein n=1 Tax=Streptomyces sp. NPDC056749 TaxID=3345936 RepID=UPI0036C925FF
MKKPPSTRNEWGGSMGAVLFLFGHDGAKVLYVPQPFGFGCWVRSRVGSTLTFTDAFRQDFPEVVRVENQKE